MKRLAFLLLLWLVLALPVFAQSGKVYRVGLLETTSAAANRANLDAFLRGLREAGYVEGKNLIIDYRSAEGRADRFPELAEDLVRAKPDVIVTRGTPAALAAKKASSIPIVMAAAASPLATGVIPNLARPGGNVTGLTSIVDEITIKRMEIIRQLLPTVKRVGMVLNTSNVNVTTQMKEADAAARSLGLETEVFDTRDVETLKRALEAAVAKRTEVLLVSGEGIMFANRQLIVDFAAKHEVPAMYASREFVDAGGLVSYGVSYPDLYHRAAGYVDRILKGAKPGDLPVERPKKLELVISQKAATPLGIVIPRELLFRADEVIR